MCNTPTHDLLVERAFEVAEILLVEYPEMLTPAAHARLAAIAADGLAPSPVYAPAAEIALLDELAGLVARFDCVNARTQDPVLVSLLVTMAYLAASLREYQEKGGISVFSEQAETAGMVELAGFPTEQDIRASLADDPRRCLVELFVAAETKKNTAQAEDVLDDFGTYLLRARAMEQLVHWGCTPLALSLQDAAVEDWVFEQGVRFLAGGDTLGLEVDDVLAVRGLRGAKLVVLGDDGEGYARPVALVTRDVFGAMQAGDERLPAAIEQVAVAVLDQHFEDADDEVQLSLAAVTGSGDLDDQVNHLARALYETDLDIIPVLVLDTVGEVDEVVALLVQRFTE